MRGDHGSWAVLERELDAWQQAGRSATFWWRDDDAVAPTPALDRLLDLAASTGAPLALAVIPAAAEDALAAYLAGHAAATTVLQHGYAHRNHAAEGAKKCELVAPGRHPALPEELSRGRLRLEEMFGRRFYAVMVPPWNRVDPALLSQLPGLGFTGLSAAKQRSARELIPGLVQANCHLDILQWRPERRFVGTAEALEILTAHLAARRSGAAEAVETSGILSHHKVHDEAAWDFLAELLARLAAHPAAELQSAPELFGMQCRPANGERCA